MRRIIKEAMFDFKLKTRFTIFLVIQLGMLIFALNFIDSSFRYNLRKVDGELKELNEVRHYSLRDNMRENYEQDFFSNENALSRLKEFYSALKSRKEFGYVEVYSVPLLLFSEDIPKEMLLGYDDGNPEKSVGKVDGKVACEVKGIAVGKDFMNLNRIRNIKGEDIQNDIFVENEEDLPIIILGNNYSGLYDIGDTIHVKSMLRKDSLFRVADILDKGASVYFNNSYYNLDCYVVTVFPSEKDIPQNEEEYFNQRRLMIMLINGEFVTSVEPNTIQEFVNEECEKTKIYPSSYVSNASNAQLSITGTSIEILIRVLSNSMIVCLLFTCISTVIFIMIKLSQNKKYYAILMLCGYSKREIVTIIVLSFAIIIGFADILGLGLFMIPKVLFRMSEVNFWLTIIPNGVILSIALIGTFFIIKETQIDKFLRGIND